MSMTPEEEKRLDECVKSLRNYAGLFPETTEYTTYIEITLTRLREIIMQFDRQQAEIERLNALYSGATSALQAVHTEYQNVFALLSQAEAALQLLYEALRSDPPDGGPQKHIMGDDCVYNLNGQDMYVAINAVRQALAAIADARKKEQAE